MKPLLLVAALLLTMTTAAHADDYGPHPDLRAIRQALPVLMATRIRALHGDPAALVIRDVVVVGNDAVASWYLHDTPGLVVLHRRNDLWWIAAEVNYDDTLKWMFDPPGALPHCKDGTREIAPTTNDLVYRLGVSKAFGQTVAVHNTLVSKANAAYASWRASSTLQAPMIWADCLPIAAALSGNQERFLAAYVLSLEPGVARLFLDGRAPTEGEMPPNPGSDAYFFFSGTAKGAPVHVASGTTLSVWFPFVLDPTLRYSLTIAGGDPVVGPVNGKLSDNTLYFTLPAFTAPAGVELMGEIDGLPPAQ